MNKTKIIALSSIMSAVGVIILGLGSLIEVLDLTAAAFASLIIIFAMIEMNTASAFMIYVVTSTLSMLLLPSKLPAVIYIVLAGLYPIIKFYIEKLRFKFFGVIFKLAFLNIALLCILSAAKFLLGIPIPDTFEITEKIVIGKQLYLTAFFGTANFAFLLYDIALTKIITLYYQKYRKHFRKFFRS